MTSVNVTTTKNTVTVNEGESTVVTVTTRGPAGPKGIDLDETSKVNGSVVYYDQPSGTFKADASRTVENLVDGGNF